MVNGSHNFQVGWLILRILTLLKPKLIVFGSTFLAVVLLILLMIFGKLIYLLTMIYFKPLLQIFRNQASA